MLIIMVCLINVIFGIFISAQAGLYDMLEKVQKFALRLWMNSGAWITLFCRLSANLPTLHTHQKYFILCTMCKIVNHLMDFPQSSFKTRASSLCSTPSHLYLQPFPHTNSYVFLSAVEQVTYWVKIIRLCSIFEVIR